jgi:myo-inositol 2-dehydrogenase/D-chiro-inositol 1-dehydrogenase
VLGSDGTLAAENELENTVVKSTTSGVTSAKPVYFFLERYMRAYGIEWSAFVDAVVDGKPVPAGIQDGVNALALAEAANQSLQSGRPVDVTAELTGA